MAKVSIATMAKAPVVELPEGFAGHAETRAIFDRDNDSLHVHVHRIERDAVLKIGPKAIDCLAYVWRGGVEAAGVTLAQGSSLIVEHGVSLEIRSTVDGSLLVTFAASQAPIEPRAGGHIHLLPAERVPRVHNIGSTSGIRGGMHADAACPTCELWLHENSFPAADTPAANTRDTGVHSHTEAEVIFVTDGQIRLGAHLHGPGTAIAIAANTFYGFSAGAEGLSFVNFRAGLPREVRFPDGRVIDEPGIWRKQLETPLQYISTPHA